MSLRAQLQQQPSGSTKPKIITAYNSEAEKDSSRCNAVVWLPGTEGSMFASAHASGTVLICKKVGGLWQPEAGGGLRWWLVAA